jgi:hypothetical protein
MGQKTEHRSFEKADEVREFPNGAADILQVGDAEIGRLTLQPGWRWSNDVKPIAGTDLCQARHTGYVISGTMIVEASDGSEARLTAGDVYLIEPGHDAWVVGEDPCLTVDFSPSMTEYARPKD